MHRSFKLARENPFAFGYAIVDPDTPRRVAADARKIRQRGLIQLCTTVDAWSPEAQRYDLGRKCLEAILPEPDWKVRILTKNCAVTRDFDLLEQYRDRVLIGLSLTATEDKTDLMKIVEPNASSISERMEALREAHRRGLRTYGMLCPLLPGIADGPEQIDRMVEFVLAAGAEEIFVEPVNPRGRVLKVTEQALRDAGYRAEGDAIAAVRRWKNWSGYTLRLLQSVREVLRQRNALHQLRFLLYPSRLLPEHKQWIRAHPDGVKWLGSEAF
jgi:DNA repair photolyase